VVGGGQLPATGGGSLNLTIIALTLIGIGAVMLRLTSKPAR
jgi:LPXTG-motif cell wall-anchored protein